MSRSSVYNNINDYEKNEKPSGKKQHHFIAFLICLFCSLILWFYVNEVESPSYEDDYSSINVSVKNQNSNEYSLLDNFKVEVDVTLIGKKSVLGHIDDEDINAFIDLSEVTDPGMVELPIHITSPNGTEVSSYFPTVVNVYVDKTMSKSVQVDVIPTYTSKSATYTIGEGIAATDSNYVNTITSITVTGPVTEVENVERAVVYVDLGDVTGSKDAYVPLQLLDKNGDSVSSSYTKSNVSMVYVSIPVTTEKTIPVTAVQKSATFSADQISFVLSPSTVKVSGDPVLLDTLSSVSVVFDETQIDTTDGYTRQCQLQEIDGLTYINNITIVTVTASLDNVIRKQLTVNASGIRLTADESGSFAYTVASNETVLLDVLLLSGSGDLLNASDFDLTADMSGYTATGIVSVPVSITYKGKRPIFILGSYTIQVVVSQSQHNVPA